MADSIRELIAQTKGELDELTKSAVAYYDAAKSLQQSLEGVRVAANGANGAVQGVFLGTPQIAGTWAHDGGSPTPHSGTTPFGGG